MAQLPASAASEPRHIRGGAGGGGRGQWVKYPLRVVLDAEAYAPADTNFYGKVKALSNGRVATASMTKLAGFLGWSKSTAERSAGRLGRPAPTDGVQEVFTKRKTHKITGTGQTAERWCRTLDKGERYVYAPVRAADTLRGVLHRLYLLLRYTAFVERRDLTLTEMAVVLRHHGGKNAGQPLHDTTVARLLDELEAAGWITQDKRAGYRGRHQITVHDDPVQPVDEPRHGIPGPHPTPHSDDGSGPDLRDGSPAYKEDLVLDDPGNTAPPGGGVRRRRGDRKWVATPVDTAGNQNGRRNITAPATFRPGPAPVPYGSPTMGVSPRVWAVLAPVADLLPAVSPFVLRTVARAIGRQLDAKVHPDDIHDQILNRRARTGAANLTDPGRWLLGVALADWASPCGLTDCVDGLIRHSGIPCKACAALTPPGRRPRGRARGHPPPTTAAATTLHQCPGCRAPYRPPLRHPNCRLCNTPLTTTA